MKTDFNLFVGVKKLGKVNELSKKTKINKTGIPTITYTQLRELLSHLNLERRYRFNSESGKLTRKSGKCKSQLLLCTSKPRRGTTINYTSQLSYEQRKITIIRIHEFTQQQV